MKEFDFENQAKNLPDSFAKSPDSNNYKILTNEKIAVDEFRKDIKAVDNSLDLNGVDENGNPYVYGKTLDLYGEMLNQPRGVATDEQYKMLIRAKITRSLAGGDLPSVLDALCVTFNCEPSQIKIIEKEDAYCTVEAVILPIDKLNDAGMTQTQAAKVIKTLLPVGVKLEVTNYEGTFEFTDSTSEYSETAGFGDLNDDTVGGYFGSIISEEDENPLPI